MSDTKKPPTRTPEEQEELDEAKRESDAGLARAGARKKIDQAATELATQVQETGQGGTVREVITSFPSITSLMVAAAVRCLGAEKFYWSKERECIVHEPDYNTQMKAVAWLAAYKDGLPIQTNVNINTGDKGAILPTKLTKGMLAELKVFIAAAERGEVPVEAEVSEKRA